MSKQLQTELAEDSKRDASQVGQALCNVAQQALEEAQARKQADKLADKLADKELNGPKGLEPTRYGDWEAKGRCYDF